MDEIIQKAQLLALRDVEIKVKEAQLEGTVIPEEVITILRNLEDEYMKVDEF